MKTIVVALLLSVFLGVAFVTTSCAPEKRADSVVDLDIPRLGADASAPALEADRPTTRPHARGDDVPQPIARTSSSFGTGVQDHARRDFGSIEGSLPAAVAIAGTNAASASARMFFIATPGVPWSSSFTSAVFFGPAQQRNPIVGAFFDGMTLKSGHTSPLKKWRFRTARVGAVLATTSGFVPT